MAVAGARLVILTRIIPTVLVRDGHVVKGERFAADDVRGNPVETVRVHSLREVDEVVVVDVRATDQDRTIDAHLVRAISESLFVPLTVGGGIRSVDDAKRLFHAGADKVVIGAAAESIGLIADLAATFGSQAVVVSVDAPDGDEWFAADYAVWLVDQGAGEILLQSIDRDGTLSGYDLALIERVAASVGVPVIASGGCSGYEDMADALRAGASAVAAGALWTRTGSTPAGARAYLADRGFPMRRAA